MYWSYLLAVLLGVLIALTIITFVTRRKEKAGNKNLNYIYDKKAQMGYVYIKNRSVKENQGLMTREIAPGVFADYALRDGALIGIEIFHKET